MMLFSHGKEGGTSSVSLLQHTSIISVLLGWVNGRSEKAFTGFWDNYGVLIKVLYEVLTVWKCYTEVSKVTLKSSMGLFCCFCPLLCG